MVLALHLKAAMSARSALRSLMGCAAQMLRNDGPSSTDTRPARTHAMMSGCIRCRSSFGMLTEECR